MNTTARFRAAALVLGMSVGCLSLWTLNPILWLWLASKIDEGGPPSMTAITVVLLGVVGGGAALGWVLAKLHGRYRQIRGIRATVKLRVPWIATSDGKKPGKRPREVELSVLDVILISSVLMAVALYQYWFLFKSGSPIDLRSGRE